MAGWIKIYRELADHWLAQHPEKLGWWVLLLLKVAHEDKKVLVGNQLVELKRGQIIASLTFLSELWQTSKSSAERFVALLEKEEMLKRCAERKLTIITICNYDSYQEKKRAKRDDARDDAETMVGQSWEESNSPFGSFFVAFNPSITARFAGTSDSTHTWLGIFKKSNAQESAYAEPNASPSGRIWVKITTDFFVFNCFASSCKVQSIFTFL